MPRGTATYGLCSKKKALASASTSRYKNPNKAGGGTLQVLLVLVFVVAVAFGAWFFRYGLSLLGVDLEPQVPDAQREAA